MIHRINFDISFVFLFLIIAVVISSIVFVATVLKPESDIIQKDRVIHSLFVIEENAKPLSTYILMYYPANKRATIFDIPGDLGLILQKLNMVDRIDAVYDTRSVEDFRKEIEKLLDIEISFSFTINLDNLGKIIDLIEGVDILIPTQVEQYDMEPPILFPPGLTRLDGDKAKTYLTYVLPDDTRESINSRRQRLFLGLLRRLREQNEMLKTQTISQLYHSLLKTNTNKRTFTKIFDEYTGINIDRLSIQTVSGSLRDMSGQMLLFPTYNGSLIKDIVRKTLGSLTLMDQGESERVWSVEVLNGTTANGLAGRTAELLRDFGYDVVTVGNADSSDYEKTIIIDHSGSIQMVQTFADIIRCKNITYEVPEVKKPDDDELYNFEYRLDFTVIIGRDFDGRYVTGG
ncbi:MAG: LCP family protein [Spirochaetaceae bacterium]|jgi:anionic cell wall polymer biosynthesis LytR-Cps2A-Psr (LCP) family protein|nr:LCP family protein [Spirochaetaceae bacterium]